MLTLQVNKHEAKRRRTSAAKAAAKAAIGKSYGLSLFSPSAAAMQKNQPTATVIASATTNSIAADGTATGVAFMKWLPVFLTSRFAIQKRLAREHNEKMVVVSQWSQLLHLAAHTIGGDHILYTGEIPASVRSVALQLFQQTNDRTTTLYMTLQLAQSCSATAARRMIFHDRWWNRPREQQAICRVDRRGQQRDVHIHYIDDSQISAARHVITIHDIKQQQQQLIER
jgi:SNF2 family DNA or RNA helicase